jgi:hypothetical protein
MTSRLFGSPRCSPSVEALSEFIWVRRSFLSSSSVESGTLSEFYEFRQRADSRVPLVYRDSGLTGYLRHYLGVGDLPIIVSHSFASLMLFVHLHTV